MADLTQVQLPNGGTYNFKDTTQTHSDHRHYETDLVPITHKTYASTSYYATSANDWNTSTWYFMSVKPDSWYKPWTVKFKVHTFCPSYSSYESITYATISGRSDSYVYSNWNERQNTAHYYTTIYPLKQAGFNAGYGHAVGISILYGDNYTNSAYYRTFEVDYYYCENCTVTILDTPVKWANWSGTGTTNYNSINSMNGASRGLMESGDSDTTYLLRRYYNSFKVGANKIFPYTLIMPLADGRWESIVTSNSTATSKSRNPHGFRLGQILYMSANTTYNENATVGNNNVADAWGDLLDHRYSFNTANDSTNGLTAGKPVYLVGTLNASDGLFYLDTTWWTQTLPTSANGKLYIYLGDAYDYYRMDLAVSKPIYRYINGMIREYVQDAGTVNGLTVEKAVPSNAVFTDNNTTYTFANGTNGFTVTPSGGSAQTVTVTPSIANNVTGSGTSGYLTKFNGANTITNAVALGSDTTKFLRNDGTWQVPSTRQIFFDTPAPPYALNDLWFGDGSIRYCTTARASGVYVEDDWTVSVDEAFATSLVEETVSCITGNNSEFGGRFIIELDSENNNPLAIVFACDTTITSNTKLWRFDANGFRFSSDGGQTYSPITNTNGELDASYITSGVLDASRVSIINLNTSDITTGDIYRGGTNNTLGTLVIKNQQNEVIGEINKLGIKIYGQGDVNARPYIIFNDTEFFAGYDADGNQIFKVISNVVNMVNASVTSNLTIGNKDGYKISFVPITIKDANDVIVNDGVAIV